MRKSKIPHASNCPVIIAINIIYKNIIKKLKTIERVYRKKAFFFIFFYFNFDSIQSVLTVYVSGTRSCKTENKTHYSIFSSNCPIFENPENKNKCNRQTSYQLINYIILYHPHQCVQPGNPTSCQNIFNSSKSNNISIRLPKISSIFFLLSPNTI